MVTALYSSFSHFGAVNPGFAALVAAVAGVPDGRLVRDDDRPADEDLV